MTYITRLHKNKLLMSDEIARSRAGRYFEHFELSAIADYHDRPDILAIWSRMLATALGPETLYQSPEFFDYLSNTAQGPGTTHELLIVRRKSDHSVVGCVPIRTISCDLNFRFGHITLFRRKLRACQILGSVPLLDLTQEGVVKSLLQQLLKRYTKCDVLYMQAFPKEASAMLQKIEGVSAYVLNGWRVCHTQPLPNSVDAYLQKFSSKKRYNLSRQVRLLTQAAGPLQVLCIEYPEQVTKMLDAVVAIDSAKNMDRDGEQARLEGLARYGLLLSYVIRCGEENIAVVYGSRSASVWHIHKISTNPDYLHLSAGTSAIHLAVQDVLTKFSFTHIDFGYGTPNAEFRSTHVLKPRGLVLLHRARSLTAMLLTLHRVCDGVNEALTRQLKQVKKRFTLAPKFLR
ncbi:GNAT family N-acetyltransferase [Massilia putida]|uniref:GNAT family N-acetyltransferase n=1 Tax=Massilia putida TaxID=1141883 RepID=UPI0009534067|nr:GNAT family N-acetyltransferase [Massilia putida]